MDQWWNWSTLSFSFSFLPPSMGRENVCCDPKWLHFCPSLCASHRAVFPMPKGAVPFQGEHTEHLLALLMCSERGNGALMAFDNISCPWFGWLLTAQVLASSILCGVWCQGQLLSGTLTVSEITHDIVPGDTPGTGVEVPVHWWALGWVMQFHCPRPVHAPSSRLGHCKKLSGISSTASTWRW